MGKLDEEEEITDMRITEKGHALIADLRQEYGQGYKEKLKENIKANVIESIKELMAQGRIGLELAPLFDLLVRCYIDIKSSYYPEKNEFVD